MNKKLFSLWILLLPGLMLQVTSLLGGMAIIMVILMATMDISKDITMVTGMTTTTIGSEIAH